MASPLFPLISEISLSDLPVMPALSGYGILWPLLVAGTCATTTSGIRKYVAEIYQRLGQQMKIEQAFVLRDMLDPLS